MKNQLLTALLIITLPIFSAKPRKTDFFDIFKQSLYRTSLLSTAGFFYQQLYGISYYSWRSCLLVPVAVSTMATPLIHAQYNKNFMKQTVGQKHKIIEL